MRLGPVVAPSRGRGSKRGRRHRQRNLYPVAPSRGRGSKRHHGHERPGGQGSPLRGGVDRNSTCSWVVVRRVMSPLRGGVDRNKVGIGFNGAEISSPLRGGVDRNIQTPTSKRVWTSPLRGGVDRNTSPSPVAPRSPEVAPSRGRGSKPLPRDGPGEHHQSPLRGGVDRNALISLARISVRVAPSRGRGSKPSWRSRQRPCSSRPFAGAWIETDHLYPGHAKRLSPLRGGVDRNTQSILAGLEARGRPFAGAWIETCPSLRDAREAGVAPSRGRGSKLHPLEVDAPALAVAPSRGRGSKRHWPS